MLTIPNINTGQTKSGKKEIAFTLRLPVELNAQLVAEADQLRRSRHSHIVYLLERYFERKLVEKEKNR